MGERFASGEPRFVKRRTPRYEGRKMHIHPLITIPSLSPSSATGSPRSDFVAVDTEFMRENTYLAGAVPDPGRQ